MKSCNNKYLLSIGMPTYNRCSLLKANINRYIPFCEKYKIQILVSDNASTDETASLCNEYKEKYNFIKYIRHSQNIGYDKNVLSCLSMSDGEYFCVWGDRRGISPEKFSEILNILQEKKYDTIVMGSLKKEHLFETYTASDLLYQYNRDFGLLCCFIQKNPLQDLDVYKKYIGHLYIHVPIVFETLKRITNIKILLINGRYFETVIDDSGKSGNHSWIKEPLRTIATEWIRTIMLLPDDLSIESKEAAFCGIPPRYEPLRVRRIIPGIAKGNYTKEEFKKEAKYIPLATGGEAKMWLLELIFSVPSFFYRIPFYILSFFYKKNNIHE